MTEHNLPGANIIWYRISLGRPKASFVNPKTYNHNQQLEDEGIPHSILWLDNSTYLLKEWMTTDNLYGFGED